MRRPILLTLIAITLSALGGTALSAEPAGQAVPEIRQIRGDLYAARNPNFKPTFPTLLYVTPAGIVLVDPLNVQIATWLRGEIKKRFNLPVRYVIYSHAHFDHARGASVFPEAHVVAQQSALESLEIARAALPVNRGYTDRDDDGRISKDEAEAAVIEHWDEFRKHDDNHVTGAEIAADIVIPDITYACRMTISLGNKTVELIHPGPNHSFDSTVVRFPAERTIYAADFLNARLWPGGGYAGAPIADWIRSIANVETLDFQWFYPAHGWFGDGPHQDVFTRADVIAYRHFYEDLAATVAQGIAAGRSLEQIQGDPATKRIAERYSDWSRFTRKQVEENIQDVYDNLTGWTRVGSFRKKYLPLLQRLQAHSAKCWGEGATLPGASGSQGDR